MLPIHSLLSTIRSSLAQHNQLILEAPTGAGKSTALPLAILDWPEITGKIIMLEPRRVAARSLATYMAKCRKQHVGEEIGYRVKGETKISSSTKIEVVTEGVLTRMIQEDPELLGIELIIFDEVHERHLTTDLGLALALEVQTHFREDLTILAMSATLSGLPLQELMPNTDVIKITGRSFPVEIHYSAPNSFENWLIFMGKQIVNLMTNNAQLQGDLLAFLPGKKEITQLQTYLKTQLTQDKFFICPLYGQLPAKEQDSAIAISQDGRRKIVLATNVAESSLTINGIGIVVDSGYKRHAAFTPKVGTTKLSLKRISQASATQRAGRAGRLSAGFCLRLWSQEQHQRLQQADEPEILYGDLLSMVFDCAYWGEKKLANLPLLTQPLNSHEQQSWALLMSLELVDINRKLTPLGQQAYALGCSPRLAHMLLKSMVFAKQLNNDKLPILACLLASILDSRSLPKKSADITDYLILASEGQLGKETKKWLAKLSYQHNEQQCLPKIAAHACSNDIGLLLALAYPDRIAKKRNSNHFLLANGTGASFINETALSQSEYILVADFQQSQGRSDGMIYLASEFNIHYLHSALSYLLNEQTECMFDEKSQKVMAYKQLKVGEIIVKQTPILQIDQQIISEAILNQIRKKGIGLLALTEPVIQLQRRIKLAHLHYPQLPWPDISDNALLTNLSTWLLPYLQEVNSLSKLAKLDYYSILISQLSWELQQQLIQYFPTKWQMLTGTLAPIFYDHNGKALLKVRLQEVLGMKQSPIIGNGSLTITMELLSPAHRPIALTSDLASFWKGPYHELKKEMKGKYPKHLWPDYPENTQPTKHTKKHISKE